MGVKAARQVLRIGRSGPRRPLPAGLVEPDAAPALTARRLWVELDAGAQAKRALRGLSLDIRRGERVVLMGRNGAGKTTLMRAVAGIVPATAGSVEAPGGVALAATESRLR